MFATSATLAIAERRAGMERMEPTVGLTKHRNIGSGLDPTTMAALATSGKFMISHLQPHDQLPHLVKPVDHYPQHTSHINDPPGLGIYDGALGSTSRYGHNLLRFDPGSNPSSQTGYYADYHHHQHQAYHQPVVPVRPYRHPVQPSRSTGHDPAVLVSERLNNYDYRSERTRAALYGVGTVSEADRGRALVGGILKNNIGSRTSTTSYHQRAHPLTYELGKYEQFNNVRDTYRTPLSVKNTNEPGYNVNYSLNFTKNQYNILISPPLHPDLGPRVAVPPYEDSPPSVKRNIASSKTRPKYYNREQQPYPYKSTHHNGTKKQTKSKQLQQQQQQQQSSEPGVILTEKQLLAQQEALAGKMQREEIIIEHSQLMGGDGTGPGAVIHPAGQYPYDQRRNTSGGSKGLGAFSVLTQGHHFTQIIAALAVSLGPLAAGLGKGYSSPAIDNLQELQNMKRGNYSHFSVNDQQVSWIASLSLLGALFGGMFGGLAMQYGRKRVLTLMSLPFSISWILTMFAKSVETMFFTAFVGGFCCAIVSTVAQVYVSEIASPDIRGFLSAIQKIAGHFGMLISYLLGAYLDWRQLALLIAMAPIMLFISVIYIPETPSFLVLRGCDDEAHRSLQWLRGPHKNVELELDTIRSNVRTTRMNLLNRIGSSTTGNGAVGTGTGTTTDQSVPIGDHRRGLRYYIEMISFEAIVSNVKSVLRNARLVKPILITCGLMIFQRFTGASSFNFYAVTIFRKTFAGMNPHGAAIAVGFVQLLASMLSGLLIDTVGRIPLLIVSSIFMSLALAGFGSCVYYGEANKMLIAGGATISDVGMASGQNDWIPLLCVLVFTVAFALGISPISWLLVGELFPLEYRAVGSSIATSFSYFCAFLSVKTFVDFQSFLGLHGTFWLYACISCVGLFFVIMVVPETKGRDLEEMDPRYVRTLTINR
ncbi:facilitated trehalose transporter Tret1-1-like [Anopheles nili]|uniref:facilitated trehalose transporter Tret1-1-like n=1 Tax=Anopheles nili TaxID=185578 RepID=UPI00237C14B2|nr:facilitated trehalose transporter Tret1-1-like [Anopheles nili]